MTATKKYYVRGNSEKGQAQDLTIECSSSDVARQLWRTEYKLPEGTMPLWVGVVKTKRSASTLSWGQVVSRS